jgi:hypothetical protein
MSFIYLDMFRQMFIVIAEKQGGGSGRNQNSFLNLGNVYQLPAILKWRLEVNLTKTNVMYIRNPRCAQSRIVFLFNHRIVSYCKYYKYLGSTLDEFLI